MALVEPPKANHWLVKQEPEDYSFDAFVAEGKTAWTGVRSYPGRLSLRGMHKGDAVLYYHSGDAKEVVGLAEVVREAYPDPTMDADQTDWSAVDLKPVRKLAQPVPLAAIKAQKSLAQIALVRQSRLSVMPLTRAEFERIVKMGGG